MIDRLFNDLGPRGCRGWIEGKQSDARQLWRALGLDLDSTAALFEPLPCQVVCWRDQWTLRRHVVEDDGMEGWTLQVQPSDVYGLDREMRRRVGQKAWARLHEQGWSLCLEMGYVAPVGETVH